MRVLRANKDSVMAMLEAFVHDPLINWRLLNTADADAPEHGPESNRNCPSVCIVPDLFR
jgi:phosphatidylinositol kinase/protein kinase (PI-3  family)